MNHNYRPPKLTETAGGVNEGNHAPSEPELYLNLRAEWDVPFLTGITLTGQVMHTSKQFINAANTQDIPDWTRLDLGARYTFTAYNREVVIRGAVENVVDDSYWTSAGGGGTGGGTVFIGEPRQVKFSVSYQW